MNGQRQFLRARLQQGAEVFSRVMGTGKEQDNVGPPLGHGDNAGRENAAPLGILLTLADYRLNVTEEIGRMIRGYYGRLVFKTEVPGNVRLKEAPSFGKPIFDYDNGSTGAEAYRQLTKEVLQRIARETIIP